MKYVLLMFIGAVTCIAYAERDPFWPIDFTPGADEPVIVEAEPTPEPQGPSEEELRQELQRKIKDALNRKATVRANGKLSALVGSQLVSEGDILSETIDGKTIKLKVKILTEENILLEPIR